jgi:cupin fold WbuC family metalloprotein
MTRASNVRGHLVVARPRTKIKAMNDSRIQIVDRALFDRLIEQARKSPRLRTNHNFHQSMDDNPHRFLNVMVRGTYITPHRHLDPPKAESFLVLRGEIAFFLFDDSGAVTRTEILGREKMGIDIASGVWHTLAVLTPEAVCYEVKPGPYSAANDKDFAPWAPREGDPSASEYLERLAASVPGA